MRILAYSKSEAYSEPCYIQKNPGIFKTRGISIALVYLTHLVHSQQQRYSECWAIQKPWIFRAAGIHSALSSIYYRALWETANAGIIFASYNYFRNTSFSCPLDYEINIFFSKRLIFIPEVFIQCKKLWKLGLRDQGRWILIFPPGSFSMTSLITFDFQHFQFFHT